MRVRGATVAVTGASSGIGRATALAFAAAGANVVVTARRETALKELAHEIEAMGAGAAVVAGDITDSTTADAVVATAVERFGRLDVWVNNAAVTTFGRFLETPLSEIQRVMDVNVMGYVRGARAALAHMHETRRGVLVNVGSIVGVLSQPYAHSYAMSKFAVRALTASLRQELLLERLVGVHACAVLPATIDTPLFDHAANNTGRRVKAMPPVYAPERVARAIVNLVRVPRREVLVGPVGRLLIAQSKVAPGLTEKLVAAQVHTTHLSLRERAAATTGNLWTPTDADATVHGRWHGHARTGMRRAAAVAAIGTIAALRRRGRGVSG